MRGLPVRAKPPPLAEPFIEHIENICIGGG
jgi:hypothetical protein